MILVSILLFSYFAIYYANLSALIYVLILFCIAAIETAIGLLFLLIFGSSK